MQTDEWLKNRPKDDLVGDPTIYPYIRFLAIWGSQGDLETGQEPENIFAVLMRCKQDEYRGFRGREGKESAGEALLELQKQVRLLSPTAAPVCEKCGR
jgi:hypothetical protein